MSGNCRRDPTGSFLDVGNESVTLAVDCLDQVLTSAVIPDSLPRLLDSLEKSGFRGEVDIPDGLEQFFFGNDPVAFANQEDQSLENPHFDANLNPTVGQGEGLGIKYEVVERKSHRRRS